MKCQKNKNCVKSSPDSPPPDLKKPYCTGCDKLGKDKTRKTTKAKLDRLIGWDVCRSKVDLIRWEIEHSITYKSRNTEFPCLVQERIASDECSETYVESLESVRIMLQHLESAV